MKASDLMSSGLWPFLAVMLAVAPAVAKEETVCESEAVEIALDARAEGVLAPSESSDILPFAYNSDQNWVRGGNAKRETRVCVRAMYSIDEVPPEEWNEIDPGQGENVLIQSSGEGTVVWAPPCQSLYRAELAVDGNVVSEAYFNLKGTAGVTPAVSLAAAVVTLPSDEMKKSGEPLTFDSVDVKLGGQQLVEGVDYVVRYADNVEVGTARVIVHGVWRYAGTAEKSFSIVDDRKQMDQAAVVTLSSESVQDTGSPCRPAEVVVKDGDETLVENVDYRLECENNVILGTGVIHVIGIGSRYVGEKIVTFEIVPAEESVHCSIYNTGGNAVDADSGRPDFLCQSFGKSDYCRLGCRVVNLTGSTGLPPHG